MDINILTIRFKNKIKPFEVQSFRGAVINSLSKKSLLFHNHTLHGLRYGYPLIQYKCIKGHATIVCAGGGTEEIWQFFEDAKFNLHIGSRTEQMAIDELRQDNFQIIIDDNTKYTYSINRWLPLNEDNFKTYIQVNSLTSRVTQLEHILTGNILSMLKGLGLHADRKILTSILTISEPLPTIYKKVRLMKFNATFQTNILMPDYLGLGRHPSVGYGINITKHWINWHETRATHRATCSDIRRP